VNSLTTDRIHETATKLGLTHLTEVVTELVERAENVGDDVLATAILGRLLHHCDVLNINGPSCRLEDRRKRITNGMAQQSGCPPDEPRCGRSPVRSCGRVDSSTEWNRMERPS
jgi:hypothetical protein